jgi:hypothetical protein
MTRPGNMSKINFLLLLISSIASFSCSKNNSGGTSTKPSSDSVNVYATGYGYIDGHPVIRYWVNNKSTDSLFTTWYLTTTFMTASGKDIYVAGQDGRCWKNDSLVENALISVPGQESYYATGIAISGNDIYLSGYADYGFTLTGIPGRGYTAVYWKNGNLVTLSDTSINMQGFATGMAVSGGDVYVGGYQVPGNITEPRTGVIWKNGSPQLLTDTPGTSVVTAVAVSGNDIYATGYILNGALQGWAYWKNGTVFIIDDSSFTPNSIIVSGPDALPGSGPTSIAFSGNDVYVAGNDYDPALGTTARVWKNGKALNLDDSGNGSYATSVFVLGNDVYVGGSDGQTGIATYWKNGSPVHFADGFEVTSLWVSKK